MANDTKLNGPSVSIASSAVVVMNEAAKAGIVGNERLCRHDLASILDSALST